MLVSLEEMKTYLRVDTSDDDSLISSFLHFSEKLCMSIARLEQSESYEVNNDELRIAVLYAVAYLYEHRENANHKELNLTLRSLLFGIRKAEF